MPKKVYIRTFGCQMNEYDSGVIAGNLVREGFVLTERPEEADVILFNGCSVREHAENRVWGKLGALSRLREQKPNLVFGVLGCMAENFKEEIFRRAPYVNVVCGPQNISRVTALVRKALEEGGRHLAVSGESQDESRKLPRTKVEDFLRDRQVTSCKSQIIPLPSTHPLPPLDRGEIFPARGERTTSDKPVCAYVTIIEGCDNFCSYCIVPYVRGRERSRPLGEILDEIRFLAENGCKEVTLLGQNVTKWQDRKIKNQKSKIKNYKELGKLLTEVSKIDKIKRIRFITAHPGYITEEFIRTVKENPKVCEHIHLPLQSGSDRVLKRMNRHYTGAEYKTLVERLREQMPECSITTDIIVGFSGEKDEDFEDTYNLMLQIGFDGAFIFKYSPRPQTRAREFTDDVPEEVKKQRNQRLLELQRRISGEKIRALIGKSEEILAERVSRENDKQLIGRTRTNKGVVFAGGKEMLGKLVKVKIKSVEFSRLTGEVCND